MLTMNRTEPWPIDAHVYDRVLSLPWFARLFRHAMEARRIQVKFQVHHREHIGGWFDTTACETDGDPSIVIYCPDEWGVFDDIEGTITLAHELGHHESWLRCEVSLAIGAIVDFEKMASYPRINREEYLEEEARAWRYGREILASVAPDFSAFDSFDRTAAKAIGEYRSGLLLA